MDTFCPTLSGDPAVIFAEQGYALFTTLGAKLYQLAQDELTALAAVAIEPISFNANFDFAGQLAAFQRPIEPIIDTASFQFQDPGPVVAPPSFTPNPVVLDPQPDTGSLVPPNLAFGQQPDVPNVPVPDPPPPGAPIVVPAPPTFTLPALPALFNINLPDAPVIVEPTFQGIRPTFVEPPLDVFNFNPGTYVSSTLSALQAQLLTMLSGGTGLPVEIGRAH